MPDLTVIPGGAESRPPASPVFTPRAVISSVLAAAIVRWRGDALRVVADPACSSGQRAIAWRFLRQHGATPEKEGQPS